MQPHANNRVFGASPSLRNDRMSKKNFLNAVAAFNLCVTAVYSPNLHLREVEWLGEHEP